MSSTQDLSGSTLAAVSAGDLVPDYLDNKLEAGNGLTKTKINPGADEQLVFALEEEVYIGNKNTNGSWRLQIIGDDLSIQKRIAGNWVEKQVVGG